MRIVSVQVAQPRSVPWKGGAVSTGIYKEPVRGRVRVRTLGLEGDAQADLQVHGGPTKAVYAYPSEHYALWRRELPGRDLPWGTFGENLTTEGLTEDRVHAGDEYRIGTAALAATKPRFPCYKLGIRFGDENIIPRFRRSGRSGIYFRVVEPGDLAAGDPIELIRAAPAGPTIADMVAAQIHEEEEV